MEIAVLIDINGESISFNQNGKIKVYSNENEEWRVTKEIPFEVGNVMNAKELRENIRNRVEELDKCKIFVAKEVKGIPFTILDSMKFTIRQLEGKPEDFLDYILEKEEEEKNNKLKPKAIPVPIKNGIEGNYFIDLKTELQNNIELSSKQY